MSQQQCIYFKVKAAIILNEGPFCPPPSNTYPGVPLYRSSPIRCFSSLFHIKGQPFISPVSMSANGIIFIKRYYQHNEQLSNFLIYQEGESDSFLNRTKRAVPCEPPLPHLCFVTSTKFLLHAAQEGGRQKVSLHYFELSPDFSNEETTRCPFERSH